MRGSMLLLWRATAVGFATLSTACLINVDYGDTQFLCSVGSECPDGQECRDNVCVELSADAGVPSPDAAPDAVAVVCPGVDADDEITALRAVGSIVVDGTLEPLWDGARTIEFANAAQSDNTVSVRLLWDDTNLYYAYEVTDAQLEAVSVVNQIFLDDGSELYLDAAHDETTSLNADDVHYIVNIDNVVQSGTVSVATTRGAGSYVMEHALSWAEVGRQPIAGDTMGALFGNNDRDDDMSSQFDWRNVVASGSYGRPNLWGDLHFSARTTAECR